MNKNYYQHFLFQIVHVSDSSVKPSMSLINMIDTLIVITGSYSHPLTEGHALYEQDKKK